MKKAGQKAKSDSKLFKHRNILRCKKILKVEMCGSVGNLEKKNLALKNGPQILKV